VATGTSLIAVREALLALLQDRPGLTGVSVTYGRPKTEMPPEAIWFDSEASADNVRLAATGGAIKKVEENYDLLVVLQVMAEDDELGLVADRRAVELFGELQQTVAAAPALIGPVLVMQISGWLHSSAALGMAEQGSRFAVTLRVTAHLTAA
jgi:hypothetical protein